MARPTLRLLSQDYGPTTGGDLVRITGTAFAAQVAVWFGGREADVVRIVRGPGENFVDVRTPSHGPALVDVVVWNLDVAGLPAAQGRATLEQSYRFVREPLVREATLTRAVRTLLQSIKRDVLANTTMTVSVDFQPSSEDDAVVVPLASLPSLVIAGPMLRENRFYGTYEAREVPTAGLAGLEITKLRTPLTVDLAFTITGASSSTIELLQMMNAVMTFLSRTHWLEMDRDPDDPSKGVVRWELDLEGEFRPRLTSGDGVRVFMGGLVIRGFDIEDSRARDRARRVATTELTSTAISEGAVA